MKPGGASTVDRICYDAEGIVFAFLVRCAVRLSATCLVSQISEGKLAKASWGVSVTTVRMLRPPKPCYDAVFSTLKAKVALA